VNISDEAVQAAQIQRAQQIALEVNQEFRDDEELDLAFAEFKRRLGRSK
jgi:hypothetical protein